MEGSGYFFGVFNFYIDMFVVIFDGDKYFEFGLLVSMILFLYEYNF